MSDLETGSCLCGQLHFSMLGPLGLVIAGLYSQLCKTSGHFMTAASAAGSAFGIKGKVTCYSSSPLDRRGFTAYLLVTFFGMARTRTLPFLQAVLMETQARYWWGLYFALIKGIIIRSTMAYLKLRRMTPVLKTQFYK